MTIVSGKGTQYEHGQTDTTLEADGKTYYFISDDTRRGRGIRESGQRDRPNPSRRRNS